MRKLVAIVLILIMIFILISCEKDPIHIGFIGDLSSKTSQLAVDARNAVQLGVDLINADGGISGRELELVIKDDASSQEQALKMHKEFNNEKVKFVIGHLTSDMAPAISSSQGEDLLFVSPSISTDNMSGIDDFFLRTYSPNSGQAKILSKYFHAKNINELVVAYDLSNAEYTKTMFEVFKENYENDQFKIKSVLPFDSTASNLDSVAEDLISYNSDHVLLISQSKDTAFLIQKMKLANENLGTYSVNWSMTNDFINEGGTAIENTILVGVYIPEDISTDFQIFSDHYVERYNAEPSFISIVAYDSFIVLVEGLKNADELTPKSVKDTIIEIGDFPSLQESFSIDKYGDSDRAYMLYILQNSQFVPLRNW